MIMYIYVYTTGKNLKELVRYLVSCTSIYINEDMSNGKCTVNGPNFGPMKKINHKTRN